MSNIHYFQRYSQKENVVTNNTLLLLSRLYNESPIKFKQFLNGLTNELNINVGVNFNQQEKSNNSIPDGAITQESFKIAIETKLYDNFTKNQLINHLKTFNKETSQVLIGLSRSKINNNLNQEVIKAIGDYNIKNEVNVHFLSTTFKDIVTQFKEVINEYDIELNIIINDYEDFCSQSQLLLNTDLRMLTVACGWTINDNFKYNCYYDPADRGYSHCTHLGIYNDKRVQGIGKIENIITADVVDGKLVIFDTTHGEATEEQKNNILNIIIAGKENLGWNLNKGNKFFCVDNFYRTNFIKNTPNGLFGKRYFNLNEYTNTEGFQPTERFAELLNYIDWEKNIVK